MPVITCTACGSRLKAPDAMIGRIGNLVEKCDPEFAIADGRLDVLLQGTARRQDENSSWSWLLMIEAKIDANESVGQLKRYDKWAEKYAQGRDILRIFLTPDARPAETAADDWTPLSFLDLVCLFRKQCPDLAHRPGYHFLRYYIAGVLKDVYHWNLPIGDPEFLDDPYNFLEYLAAIFDDELTGLVGLDRIVKYPCASETRFKQQNSSSGLKCGWA